MWDLGRADTPRPAVPDNPPMSKNAVAAIEAEEMHILDEDVAQLTPKELEQERKAQMEELRKRSWMADSARQLADRIPVSVFAMGDLASAN